ncbi:MAG TPA: ATP-binding protein, partial [Thermoplasmata archaeon]|nr:ATP-binding protein [Thermoplasmata archaeon]
EVAAASGTLLRVLANSFNSHPEVVFVFTGSRYGLVRALLDPPTGSPLFGRSPATIELHPFTPERSLEFLERGLREYHRTVDRDQLRAVIDRSLDGVPGWLTLFGSHLALQRLSVEKAEELTVAEARKVVRGELAHFLKGRERGTHWDALRLMVSGASWTEIRDGLAARRGSPVNDNTVRNVVRNLSAAGLVEKVDDRYVLPDPMVRGYVRSLARPPEPRPEDERRRSASAD